jgi:hypothetical protein
MDQSYEEEDLVECIDCSAELSPEGDRGFALSDDSYLCFTCAMRRGGNYDYAQERWVVEPNVADEPDQRRAHP